MLFRLPRSIRAHTPPLLLFSPLCASFSRTRLCLLFFFACFTLVSICCASAMCYKKRFAYPCDSACACIHIYIYMSVLACASLCVCVCVCPSCFSCLHSYLYSQTTTALFSPPFLNSRCVFCRRCFFLSFVASHLLRCLLPLPVGCFRLVVCVCVCLVVHRWERGHSARFESRQYPTRIEKGETEGGKIDDAADTDKKRLRWMGGERVSFNDDLTLLQQVSLRVDVRHHDSLFFPPFFRDGR